MKRFFAWAGGDLDLDKVEKLFDTYAEALADARARRIAPFRMYELQPYPVGHVLFNEPSKHELLTEQQNEGH